MSIFPSFSRDFRAPNVGFPQLRWRQMPVPQRVDALEEVRRSAAGQRRVQLREARGPPGTWLREIMEPLV
jgi:hypothetical protein